MWLSEEEKKEILSKYNDDTSDDLLRHLKRTYSIHEVNLDWLPHPLKFIGIDGKSYDLSGNKKFLVNKISSSLEDEWIHLGTNKIRRTIKKFLDGMR